jgi:predicted transcriptional regulator of viral defense system
MKSTEALAGLSTLRQPVFRTRDAADWLGLSASAASRHLTGLSDTGLIAKLGHGLWSTTSKPDQFVVASWIAMPQPSYVSLYTALRIHGLIQQMPRTVFVVTTAKTRAVRLSSGTYSLHQIDPHLFGGFTEQDGRRVATPEKAVFDTLYLRRARSARFRGMTEVEVPSTFRWSLLHEWVSQIPDSRLRSSVDATVADWTRHVTVRN